VEKDKTYRFIVLLSLISSSLLFHVYAEKVYKFRYNDSPEPLNNKIVSVKDSSVALDRYILVGDSTDEGNAVGVASVMFIVDHTGIPVVWGNHGQTFLDSGGRLSIL
jgi:hypothetical protein